MRGWAACRVLGIDVRHTAAWPTVSQNDAVMADQELTDAGLVVACAGFDDCHGTVDRVLLFDIAEQHYVVGQMRNGRVRQTWGFEQIAASRMSLRPHIPGRV